MKIKIISENVRHEEDGKRTIVELKGYCHASSSREFKELVPEGEYTGLGVSKCHPEDTPDQVLGYRIARSRAYSNLFKQILSIQSREIEKFVHRFDISILTCDKYAQAVFAQEQDIQRLTGKQSTGREVNESYEQDGESFDDVIILPKKSRDLNHSRRIQNVLRKEGVLCGIDYNFDEEDEYRIRCHPLSKFVFIVDKFCQSKDSAKMVLIDDSGNISLTGEVVSVEDLVGLVKKN